MEANDRCALGILELSSIARGIVVADAALKQAPSLLIMSRPVSSGKHLVMMRGQVAEVQESMAVGREVAGDLLVDSLELPYAHDQIWPLLDQPVRSDTWNGDEHSASVAIIETTTVCAAIGSADAAVKTAPVLIRDVRLAVGIAGKAFYTLTGELPDVQASADAAGEIAGDRVVNIELIASPADELRGRLIL